MKIYFRRDHYDKSYRRHLFALLKPFIKGENYSDEDRIVSYGISENDISFADRIQDSDFVILTMSWMYYKLTDQVDKAKTFIMQANDLGKKVILSLPSDYGINIPKELDVIILREQGYKSKLRNNSFCAPVFIEDPLKKYYNKDKPFHRAYTSKPTIGFCGQADGRKREAIKEFAKIMARNILYHLGIRYQTPHQIITTKYLRSTLLKSLKSSSNVTCNFIIRKKHRAGVEFLKNRDTHETTLEFFDNIKNSDYILCVRGVGNFSVRFYETLAMGRIPVFVDTDCILPHHDFLNWKNHVVWVDYKNRHKVSQIVEEFHQNLDEDKLNALFKANRRLWEERLKLKTYFQSLFEYI